MTEITAPKSPITTAEFADEIREQLKYTQGVTVEQASPPPPPCAVISWIPG